MAFLLGLKTSFVAVLVLVSSCVLPAEADVRAVNQCPYDLTLFYQNETPGSTQQRYLPRNSAMDLGLPNPWTGGLMWASPHGNSDAGQCTQLEFNIGAEGRDYYDISLVNAYNVPAMINPTYLANGDYRNDHECGTIMCSIPDLSAMCQNGNYYQGPDGACINRDGPTGGPTPGTELVKQLCPNVYPSCNENAGVVFACNTGSNYDAIWCP
ncbi:unnamed protein product [Calypogeia fissa]